MEGDMAWLYLVIAGLFEVAWAIGLKLTDGWTRLVPSLLTVIAMAVSFGFLSLALKSLPIGTAYAVWTGIGAVGTAIVGILAFSEPATALRLGCIGLILGGIVGLKVVG
jgi:quaternary ammonium compound-resistance protein SugE